MLSLLPLLLYTVRSKLIRALVVMLVIFLSFKCQFLSSHACYKQYEIKRSWLDKYLFHKSTLGMNFLTRIISCARIILLPTVRWRWVRKYTSIYFHNGKNPKSTYINWIQEIYEVTLRISYNTCKNKWINKTFKSSF